MLTLGSLFDGIGGWCLAAQHNGVKPVWSSEIEKFPLAVTRIRFPDVKQLGDIREIDGGKIEPVDIICAGSPCQDLSIANGSGRKGLDGERSGLFAESVRIVRQMQRATGGRYPAFYCWENVPGAYSSNTGNDFRTVLGLLAETDVPNPTGGVWADAGMVERNGCQIAWRTINAEFYGVPQRRRRIFLVCDFRGYRAGEILFIEPGVCRNYQKGEHEKQGFAGGIKNGANNTSRTIYDMHHPQNVIRTFKDICPTLISRMGTGGNNVPIITDNNHKDVKSAAEWKNEVTLYDITHNSEAYPNKGISPTLNARMGTGGNQVPIFTVTNVADKNTTTANKKTVRRLTPRECERLQGLPDDYTLIEDKRCNDGVRYKALGNGMCQNCADFVIRRIVEVTKEDEKC